MYHLNKLVILFRLTKSVLLFWCVPTLPFVKTVEVEVYEGNSDHAGKQECRSRWDVGFSQSD